MVFVMSDAGATEPSNETKTGTSGAGKTSTAASEPGKFVRAWAVVLILGVWTVTVFLGTVALTLPREGTFTTRDGQPLDFCSNIDQTSDAPALSLCTLDGKVIGHPGSDDVVSHVGGQLLDFETVRAQFGKTLFHPQFWLALGLGGTAVFTLFSVARSTGTFRTGLATSVTLIFFGILLFPGGLTAGLDHDLRSELINAWKVVIAFYFGSEAAVQAFKVFHPTGRTVTGDVPDAATSPATREQAH